MPELDAKFERYETSTDQTERTKLAEEIQRTILEGYYFVPVYRHTFINAIGPKVVAKQWEDVFPQYNRCMPTRGRTSSCKRRGRTVGTGCRHGMRKRSAGTHAWGCTQARGWS